MLYRLIANPPADSFDDSRWHPTLIWKVWARDPVDAMRHAFAVRPEIPRSHWTAIVIG